MPLWTTGPTGIPRKQSSMPTDTRKFTRVIAASLLQLKSRSLQAFIVQCLTYTCPSCKCNFYLPVIIVTLYRRSIHSNQPQWQTTRWQFLILTGWMNKCVKSHYYTSKGILLAFSRIVDISIVCWVPWILINASDRDWFYLYCWPFIGIVNQDLSAIV